MAKKPAPKKKPAKPAPSRAKAPAAKNPAKPVKKTAPAKKAPAKPVKTPVKKASVKEVRKPAKPAAKSPVKAAVKPAAKATVKPAPSLPPNSTSGQVDPLLAGGRPPIKLIGGLDRDAQLPTTLVPKPDLPAAVPLTVHAQAVPGAAHHGNNHPANLLVLVSCAGWPVADLNEDHFSVMEHFDVPGQTAPFSSNIVSFRNGGSGAYLLQVKPIGSASWVGGQHLAQILVSSPDERHGQTAVKLIIR